MKKVLITGGNGMLAADLNNILHIHAGFEVLSLGRADLDITNQTNVESVFLQYRPDVVIHTAALTNVDYCEEDPDTAFKINAVGSENIAFYSDKAGAKMVYISSCGLFGDEIHEYTETDEVILKTQYAKSKYLGEQKVQERCSKHFIVRPGWLFGGSKTHKKNFVYNRYLEALKNPQVKSAGDKYGCPTYTAHLASKLFELLDSDCYGVYHVSNSNSSSRYDYVKQIIKSFGLPTEVMKVDSSNFKRSAPVPDCEVIKNENLMKHGFTLLPSWNEAIEEYVYKLKQEL